MTPELTDNLPQIAYSAQQVKENEALVAAQQNIPMYSLMQSAAQAVFDLMLVKYRHAEKIQIIAGGGNNAGDGYWIANYALQHDFDVSVYSVKSPSELSGDAKRAHDDYLAQGGHVVDVLDSTCDVYIDALLGIGFYGQLSELYVDVIKSVNSLNKPIIAVDLPSGLNATSAEASSTCIKADYTVTFIALKQGLLTGNAKEYVGKLFFAGLGLCDAFAKAVTPKSSLVDFHYLKTQLPARHANSYKQQLGHVLFIGGDETMPGAIRIAAESCLRAGAGLVSVATHPNNRAIVVQGRYELMVHGIQSPEQLSPLLEKADVCVIGPGLGQSPWGKSLWQEAIATTKPLVIDADALNLLANQPAHLDKAILTPHAGEASRLLGISSAEIELNRFESVSNIVRKFNATVVLKGAGSLIAEQNKLAINMSGSASMASAGMGDCLSGIIAALIAQGMSNFDAVQLAVNIHGRAAEQAEQQGKRGLLASDLLPFIRKLVD